jgi:hypothetical protein
MTDPETLCLHKTTTEEYNNHLTPPHPKKNYILYNYTTWTPLNITKQNYIVFVSAKETKKNKNSKKINI